MVETIEEAGRKQEWCPTCHSYNRNIKLNNGDGPCEDPMGWHDHNPMQNLTDRDKELLILISEGYTYDKIAKKYKVVRDTVANNWMRGLYSRAGIPDGDNRRMRLIIAAVRAGVI